MQEKSSLPDRGLEAAMLRAVEVTSSPKKSQLVQDMAVWEDHLTLDKKKTPFKGVNSFLKIVFCLQ
jgi:hypothetical protein